MSIRMRLALVVGAASVALFAIGGLIGVWLFARGLTESLDGHLSHKAKVLASTLEADNRHGVPPTSLAAHPNRLLRLDKRRGAAVLQVLGPHGAPVDLGTAGDPLVTGRRLDAARHQAQYLDVAIGSPPDPLRVSVSAVPGMPGWILAVGLSSASNQGAVQEVERDIVLTGGIAVVVATVGAWWLAGAALAPVEKMRRRAAEISEHDLTARLHLPDAAHELTALARTMDDLLARHQWTLAHQRAFIADAGHELRTPLAVLSGELEMAGRPGRSQEELVQAVRRATTEAARISRLAQDLLLLATADEGRLVLRREPFDTFELLDAAVAIRASQAVEQDVGLTIEIGPGTERMVGDALRLRQVVDNLLDNAMRFAPSGSLVEITAARTDAPDEIVLQVRDDGPGFVPDFIPLAFQRFSRPTGARSRATGGAGLGLAVVRSVAEAHGGRVEAENRTPRGATVRIFLPHAVP